MKYYSGINNNLYDEIHENSNSEFEFSQEKSQLTHRLRISIPIYHYIKIRCYSGGRHQSTVRMMQRMEEESQKRFPSLEKEHLEVLEGVAYEKAKNFFVRRGSQYNGNAFQRNTLEKNASIFIDKAKKKYLKNFSDIQIKPKIGKNRKLVGGTPLVGVFPVDIFIEGMGPKGYSATVIEVNGKVHETLKGSKDADLENFLAEEMKVFPWALDTNKIYKDLSDGNCKNFDRTFFERGVRDILYSAGPDKNKRRRISKHQKEKINEKICLMNIACWLSFSEIEWILDEEFGIDFKAKECFEKLVQKRPAPKGLRGYKNFVPIVNEVEKRRPRTWRT